MEKINFEAIKNNIEINTYIKQADASLASMGYTEHSFVHISRCVAVASQILTKLGYDAKEVDLVKIAAYMHDIGNIVNRADHAHNGAIIAFNILNKLGLPSEDIASIVTAIGHHDEHTAYPVNAITAALLIADKTDVRRSRVRTENYHTSGIHGRVNYAVFESLVNIDNVKKIISLNLKIDTEICPVMEYFEIFLERMLLCRKASEFFGCRFQLKINEVELL